MPTHLVKQGECLSSIAEHYDLPWKTIYNHAQNAALRERRPNPNVLFPGDEIFVPEPAPRDEQAPTDNVHKFVKQTDPTMLRLVLKDHKDQPLSSKKYKLVVAGDEKEGYLPGNGLLEQPIPGNAATGEITVWLNEDPELTLIWSLRLGGLDPINQISGVQGRLNNLGFFCGSVDGIAGPKTRRAIRAFQQASGLQVTGEIDAALRTALESAHDKV